MINALAMYATDAFNSVVELVQNRWAWLTGGAAAYLEFRRRRTLRLDQLGPLYTKSQDVWRSVMSAHPKAANAVPLDVAISEWWRDVREKRPLLSSQGFRFLQASFEDCMVVSNTMRGLVGLEEEEYREAIRKIDDAKKKIAYTREMLTAERSVLIDPLPLFIGRALRRLRLI